MLIFADGKTCSCRTILTLPDGSLLAFIADMNMVEAIAFLSDADLSKITFQVGDRSKDYLGFVVIKSVSSEDDGVRVKLGRNV